MTQMKFNKERRWRNSPVAGFCCNPWIRCVLNFDKCQPPCCNFRVCFCWGTIFRLGIRLLFLSMSPWGKEWGRHLYCVYFFPGVVVKFTRKSRGHFAIYLLKSACMQLHAFLDITVHLDVLSLPCKEIIENFEKCHCCGWIFTGYQFQATSSFSFAVAPLHKLSWGAVFAGMGLGFSLSLLFFMDQNISSAMVNNPGNRWVVNNIIYYSFKIFCCSDWLKPHA